MQEKLDHISQNFIRSRDFFSSIFRFKLRSSKAATPLLPFISFYYSSSLHSVTNLGQYNCLLQLSFFIQSDDKLSFKWGGKKGSNEWGDQRGTG